MPQCHKILHPCGTKDIFQLVWWPSSLATTSRLYFCQNMLFHHTVQCYQWRVNYEMCENNYWSDSCQCQFLGLRPFHGKMVFKLKGPPGELCMFSAGITSKHPANKCCFILRATHPFLGLFVHKLKSHLVSLVMSTSQPVSSSQIFGFKFCGSINMQTFSSWALNDTPEPFFKHSSHHRF